MDISICGIYRYTESCDIVLVHLLDVFLLDDAHVLIHLGRSLADYL